MSPTTGASLNGLFMRCLGTVVGGIIALVVWYVVVGKSAGVVVLSLVALAPRISWSCRGFNGRLLLFSAGSEEGIFRSLRGISWVDSSDVELVHYFPPRHRLRPRSKSPISLSFLTFRSKKSVSPQSKRPANLTSQRINSPPTASL